METITILCLFSLMGLLLFIVGYYIEFNSLFSIYLVVAGIILFILPMSEIFISMLTSL